MEPMGNSDLQVRLQEAKVREGEGTCDDPGQLHPRGFEKRQLAIYPTKHTQKRSDFSVSCLVRARGCFFGELPYTLNAKTL